MTVDAGEQVFSLGTRPCAGIGLRWADTHISTELKERIESILLDEEGSEVIAEMLSGLTETEFSETGLREIFKDRVPVESWRIGEAIAEIYLNDHRSCRFPWPHGRDKRRSESILTGPDLVGLGVDIKGGCFAFCEVKTTSERRHPPRVMYDLRKQLFDIRDEETNRISLVRYLSLRARSFTGIERHKHAIGRFMQNSCEIQLYGFLVSDVSPHEADLRASVNELATACPIGMEIEFIVLYLPEGRLSSIRRELESKQAGKAK